VSALQSTRVTALLEILDRYAGVNVWVIGDLMIDEYVTGAVDRISPEAPVPVVRVGRTEFRLGGAANVARQAAVLGANVSLAGIVGNDSAGDDLLRMCRESGVDGRGIVVVSDRRTTRKLRIIGHSQQLLRLDWEDTQPSATQTLEDMLARLAQGPRPDVIIVSDYAKGAITAETVARIANGSGVKGCPILVDPKSRDFARYRGATTITPNLRELEIAAGKTLDPDDLPGIADAARRLSKVAGIDAMVVTLSERGMLVVPVDGEEVAIPAVKREVYDVTGAGDTAIATLAVSLAAGANLSDSSQIGNAAAGVSVGQIGAVAVDVASIRHALADLPATKVLSREDLSAKAASWRAAGKRIVFTNGCFDLLHAGHLSLLNGAAKFGDVLVVAINSDASVKRLKGPQRPLVSEAERSELLAALSCVDAVTIFDEDTPLETVERVRPHVLVKGQDYQNKAVVGREIVEANGGRVELVPLVAEKSTSALVERIRGAK
jgi:D-beta-D-heptose 7-phosphate kinase/D-beta-D-heptose 1-phosphate adenosyltransferase